MTEARSLLADRPSAGILSAENDAGYIYAVCGYQVDSGEADAAEMALRIVVNVGWRAAADPLWPLLTAVDTIARNHDCVGARADGAVIAAAGERSRWEGLGYRWTGKFLRKELSRSKSDSGPGHRSVM
ncbi:MAG: hypothetical protein KIT36_04105 [Alphaproteobacteria bacterium]|nr:hypothetical protein [Alphaproteobacteria bacterium]